MQVSSVIEHREQHENLRAVMMSDNPTVTEIYFISSFVSELKTEMRPMIKLLKPHTLNQAFEQALLQEQSIMAMVKSQYFSGTGQYTPPQKFVPNSCPTKKEYNIKTTSRMRHIPRRIQSLFSMWRTNFLGHQCKVKTLMALEESLEPEVEKDN